MIAKEGDAIILEGQLYTIRKVRRFPDGVIQSVYVAARGQSWRRTGRLLTDARLTFDQRVKAWAIERYTSIVKAVW